LSFNDDKLNYISGDLAPKSNPAPKKEKNITIEAPKRELKKTLYEMFMGMFH